MKALPPRKEGRSSIKRQSRLVDEKAKKLLTRRPRRRKKISEDRAEDELRGCYYFG